jgi:hypothetical protein
MGVQPDKEGPAEGLQRVSMKKPVAIDPRAEKVLSLLAGKDEASEIVLGGYFALQHYADYRRTHDIDAWWKTMAVAASEQAIREAMQQLAQDEGCSLRERKFGDTVSYELVRGNRKEFSFQISVRSVGIEEPLSSAWPPVLIETLSDNIASKMTALVDRGAPRDFTDIRHVVTEALVTIEAAWDLWRRRNPGDSVEAGKQKALLHLVSLESRRPVDSIPDGAERERAREAREWFKLEFLKL